MYFIISTDIIYFCILFLILTIIINREDVRDHGSPGSIGENQVESDDEADENNTNERPNGQFSNVDAGVISDHEDENRASIVGQNGPVPNAPEAPEYIDESNDERPNSPVSVLKVAPEALPIGEVQVRVDPPAVGNVGNVGNGNVVDRAEEFDFSVLDGDLRKRPPRCVDYLIDNQVDVANFFPDYLKIKCITAVNRHITIEIEVEEKIRKKMSLCVTKYAPKLEAWFMNRRRGYSKPRENFENSYGTKFTSTLLHVVFDEETVNNKFEMLMMLELGVGKKVKRNEREEDRYEVWKMAYIRFDWDPTNSKIIMLSFYNHHDQIGDLKITKNKENRLKYCRNEKCNNPKCGKSIHSRFIKEAYLDPVTWLTLIYLPVLQDFLYDVTVEKNFEKSGLHFLFRGWRTLTTWPHKHAFTLSQKEKNPFGINFGDPRTKRDLIPWLRNGNVLKVNINFKKRSSGDIKHTIRFELRLEGDRPVPSIMDVDPNKRTFPSYSSSSDEPRQHLFPMHIAYSPTSNRSFC